MLSSLYQHPWPPAFCGSAPVVSVGAQASGLRGPLPQAFSLQLELALLPPLGCRGAKVSRKVSPRLRARLSTFYLYIFVPQMKE